VKVLVMGGTQFNGLALVRELVRAGHDVTVLNRGRTDAVLPAGVERLVADRTDPESVRRALAGRDWDCVQDVSAYRPADVELMAELLRGRTGHYVFASSTVIYAASDLLPITESHPVDRSERQNEYGLNKILCEDHLVRQHREHGFPATIVAFSMVFGPHNILPDREQRMMIRLLRGRKVLIPGDGTTVGQVGHVYDEARALRMLMGEPVTFGKRYNLTGADAFTDHGYVDTIADVLGVEANELSIPPELMDDLYAGRATLGGAGLTVRVDTRGTRNEERAASLFQLQRLIQRIAPHLHHWNRSVFFGIDRLRRDVGFEPEYTFRGAVEQTWEWMRSERLHETLDFDFSGEDALIERIEAGASG
jgi:nucleoside-diphosphate-sugar epimerase